MLRLMFNFFVFAMYFFQREYTYILTSTKIFFLKKNIFRAFKMLFKNYNNISACNECVDVNQLLKDYENNNLKAIDLLFKNPDEFIKHAWKPHGTLLYDNECRCKMGEGDVKSAFSCYNCKNLKRLVDFRLDSVYQPFQIECGENLGLSLILVKNDILHPKLFWDSNSADKARIYLRRYSTLQSCGTPNDISNMKCLRGDPFTIRILIDWNIEKYMKDQGLSNTLKNYTSYICGQHGYSLFEYPTIGNFKKLLFNKEYLKENYLDPTITKGIIQQLVIILRNLSRINFTHGNPSFKSIFFNKKKFVYTKDGVKFKSPITILFSNYLYSSLMINNVHISSKTSESDIHLQRASFTPDISVKSIPSSYCTNYVGQKNETVVCTNTKVCPNNETTKKLCLISEDRTNFYKLTNDTIDIYTNMRHIGFPLFVGSFDFYCFIVSFMCCKKFFESIYADEELYRFWAMLWSNEDIATIESKIRVYHDDDNVDNLSEKIGYELIKGMWLRCNVIDYVWEMMKMGW